MRNTIQANELLLNNEDDTRRLGLEIAAACEPGDIIALIGDLGTGKTSLTRYIAEGLGVTEDVISPTFTIVREYRSGRLPLFHFDVYRLSGGDELIDSGAGEYLDAGGVCVIEWADIVADVLPADALAVRLEYGEEPGTRMATVLY